jgi:hypothetical protein
MRSRFARVEGGSKSRDKIPPRLGTASGIASNAWSSGRFAPIRWCLTARELIFSAFNAG